MHFLTSGALNVSFWALKYEHARGLLPANVRSPVVLFVVSLAAVMLGVALMMTIPVFFKLGVLVFSLIPILITVAGIVSCVRSEKPTNITLLWILIMILAPLLGPLLWFAWGRRNT